MRMAVTREISPAIVHCELTHQPRVAIDFELARKQHAKYEQCLVSAGCTLERLQTTADLPDSVFVEDIAIVFAELAVIAHPGAGSRRREIPIVADALKQYRTLERIEPPATLDGGDVLVMGRRVFVGHSRRTNIEGIEQLRRILAPWGYSVEPVRVEACLHLKSAVTAVSDDTVLINRDWVPVDAFTGLALLDVDREEPWGANALRIDRDIIYPTEWPKTLARLETRGFHVQPVDVGELAKAEGAVTCCSLVFEV
ncbi:MAG: dimethylarginine dimethylaminohydrolase family protein [Vicinamibacterales bacterium]